MDNLKQNAILVRDALIYAQEDLHKQTMQNAKSSLELVRIHDKIWSAIPAAQALVDGVGSCAEQPYDCVELESLIWRTLIPCVRSNLGMKETAKRIAEAITATPKRESGGQPPIQNQPQNEHISDTCSKIEAIGVHGYEISGDTIYIGPMRPDRIKVADVTCTIDWDEAYTDEAKKRRIRDAERICRGLDRD
jgi:hypothetical protein